jgi:APA family basic amino acid/polyamine antiporter
VKQSVEEELKNITDCTTVLKFYHLQDCFLVFFAAKARFGMPTGPTLGLRHRRMFTTGAWTSISGVTLISAISAALVGSMFSSVAWKEQHIAGEIKIET